MLKTNRTLWKKRTNIVGASKKHKRDDHYATEVDCTDQSEDMVTEHPVLEIYTGEGEEDSMDNLSMTDIIQPEYVDVDKTHCPLWTSHGSITRNTNNHGYEP